MPTCLEKNAKFALPQPACMHFELTREFLDDLRDAIADNNGKRLVEVTADLHPADLAEILDELDLAEAGILYKVIPEEVTSDVLMHMEDDSRDRFLESLSAKEIAKKFIEDLESDDAADVIAELSVKKREEVLSNLEDLEQAQDIVDLLNYQEGTAGALMGKELIQVNHNWTVTQCISEIRQQAEYVDQVFTVYVIDDNDKLLGRLSVKELLITPDNTLISEMYKSGIKSVKTSSDEEDVANIMEKYDLVVLPVVDELGRLVGRITIDDVVDVIKEEAEKDYQLASGISQDVESSDSIWMLTRARIPWLLIGLVGGVLGAKVIKGFEGDIEQFPELAFFIPLIAAMGGNVGVQSSAIIVQGLANKSLGMEGISTKLVKEFGVALINGLTLGTLICLYIYLVLGSSELALTVSLALVAVIIFAALFGTFVPLVLDRYKIDPALATGPFITTVNDILGLVIYFLIGQLVFGI